MDNQSEDLSSYEQVSHEDHIKMAPDTYVGSIEKEDSVQYVIEDGKLKKKKISWVPAFYKIYDEILVNAEDHSTRLKNKPGVKYHVKEIKIEINRENGEISIYNDGEGIDIVKLEKYDDIYAPTLIFGKLLAGTNFDQEEDKIVGGKNGYGAKLANIFSTKFTIETVDSKRKLYFKQCYYDNMEKSDEPIIKSYKSTPFTRLTFTPDYKHFNMPNITDDMYALFHKRVFDVSSWTGESINVYFNGEKIEINNFRDYVDMYLEDGQEKVYECVNDRWEYVLTHSTNDAFEQVSFVNGICTIRGGKHVEYIADQVKDKMVEFFKKKHKLDVNKNIIKNQLSIFLRSVIVNPSFDSQTKETLNTNRKNFGSECIISQKSINKLAKSKFVEKILAENEYKTSRGLKKNDGKKSRKIVGIPKLSDANKAGSRKYAKKCTLILTEGDSAKATAIAGLSVVGRDYWGVFPLKGKLLNVKDITNDRINKNEEINNLIKIIGLKNNTDYDVNSENWPLRYGKIMIMTDQDHDGSHIKGLVINLFHSRWPSLFKSNFITCLVTPIVKCFKKKSQISFYTLNEYEDWKKTIENIKSWRIKYYKGLGTSSVEESKHYFKNMAIQSYIYNPDTSNSSINLAFDKKLAHARKKWLEEHDPKQILDFGKKDITYDDFVNLELIQFSKADCVRSIPDIRDGLKPSLRKIMYACMEKFKNDSMELKVAQLAGFVSERCAYHHGEMSLMASIVNLAQNFVGSNNINLLYPSGQFGTRLKGGKDSASPRYIFTKLAKFTKLIIRPEDMNILDYLNDDGQSIEPECFYPIIPLILVNGSKGIGTGWSTNIPNFSPVKIINQLLSRLDEKAFLNIKPYYAKFKGTIELENGSYVSFGKYEIITPDTIKILELPIGEWTDDYKLFLDNSVKDKINEGKKTKQFIKSYEDHCTDTEVMFIVKFVDTLSNITNGNLNKIKDILKLKSSRETNIKNMVLYNADKKLKKYKNISDILEEFYHIRLGVYEKRRLYLIDELTREINILEDKYKYIELIIADKLILRNKKKQILVEELETLGFRKVKDNYDYLLRMELLSQTKEKVEELRKKYEDKLKEVKYLKSTTNKEMWKKELLELKTAFK